MNLKKKTQCNKIPPKIAKTTVMSSSDSKIKLQRILSNDYISIIQSITQSISSNRSKRKINYQLRTPTIEGNEEGNRSYIKKEFNKERNTEGKPI